MSGLAPALLDTLLDAMPVARLALEADAGRPEALPLVYARVATRLYSPIDGKPKQSSRLSRLAHLQRTPEVSLLLDHYADDWSALWWVKLDVTACVLDAQAPDFDAAVAALAAKYPQYGEIPMFKDAPTLIGFDTRRVRWWAARGEAGLRDWLEGRRVGR